MDLWYYIFVWFSEATFGTLNHDFQHIRRGVEQAYFTASQVENPQLDTLYDKLVTRLAEF